MVYQTYRVFLSSPKDVQTERDIAQDIITKINSVIPDVLGLRAECIRWENMPRITQDPDEGRLQDRINDLIRTCHLFVLILYKRYGSTESGERLGNTEREVNLALDLLQTNKKIKVLAYFRELPGNDDPGEQQTKAVELRERLAAEGVFYTPYETPQDFRDLFTHALYNAMIRFRWATFKSRSLMKFWQLGVTEELSKPKLAIIYPPLDRSFMKHESPDRVWLERLLPNVVYEDFKAMQIIDKTLRLIGFSEIETHSAVSYPPGKLDMNRLWICLPRNPRGIRQMAQHQDISRFRFIPRKGKSEGYLYWRQNPHGSEIAVRSPLSKYLKLQRGACSGGEWKPEYGKIVARDFAVLARFPDRSTELALSSGVIQDYFLAGIRGLGTWGAAWFVDKMYQSFLAYESEEDPIQLLLEVTYVDDEIIKVRDVSNEPESYFAQQIRASTIRGVTAEHRL